MRLVARRAIPVVVCIDVEPDPRWIDPGSAPPWHGFAASVAFFESVRRQLRFATGAPAHLAWFLRMDPQVEGCYGDAAWIAREHAATIDSLERSGDEIGLHVHMWRWDEPARTWIADHGDAGWVGHCLDSALAAYRESRGRDCASFRFGDGWCSGEALARLDAAGVRFDLTGEPESQPRPSLVPGEASTGSLPGWIGVPRSPYRPSFEDFRRPDPRRRRGIWEIPLTAGTRAAPEAAAEAEAAGVEGAAESAPWRTLNLTLEPEIFRAVVDRVLEAEPRPYLGFMVRTDDALGGAREVVLANLEFVATHACARRLRFSTPGEAMRRLGLLSLRERARERFAALRRRS